MKTILVQNVSGKLGKTRAKFDVIVKINLFGYAGKMYQVGDMARNLNIAPSLERKIARLAKRAARHDQEIVDWTAL